MKKLKNLLTILILLFIITSCKESNDKTLIINTVNLFRERELYRQMGIHILEIETLDFYGNRKLIGKGDTTVLQVKYRSRFFPDVKYRSKAMLTKYNLYTNYTLIRRCNQYLVISNDSTEEVGFLVNLKGNKQLKFKNENGKVTDNYFVSLFTLLAY